MVITVALWTHWIAPRHGALGALAHVHQCVMRQTPNGSGRRCPLRVRLPPPGQASCPHPAPTPCDHCPIFSTQANECLLIICTVFFDFPWSALASVYFMHHCFSLSKCSSLVHSLPVLPPESATYCLNPAAFVFTHLFLILVFCCSKPRSKMAICNFSPDIHF